MISSPLSYIEILHVLSFNINFYRTNMLNKRAFDKLYNNFLVNFGKSLLNLQDAFFYHVIINNKKINNPRNQIMSSIYL